MTDIVNIGTGPNSHNGDLLRNAFANINTAIAACQAASPITVSGLNALTLSASTIAERSARGTAIGTIGARTAGSTLRLADQNETRFWVVGTQLQAGPSLLDVGTVPVTIEELFDTGTATITRQTTLNITVSRDAATWPVVVPTVWAAPTAQGTGDGSTAANAKAITAIPGTLAPGAIVGVRADLGAYNLSAPLILTNSGTSGSHIKWIGVDAAGKRTLPKITGGRWPYRKQSHDPEEVIQLFTLANSNIQGINAFQFGAISYVDFEDLAFEDVQVCFNQAGGNPDNLTFRRIHMHNVQRGYEHTSTSAHSNCLWDGFVAFMFSKSLVRFRGSASNLTLQNGYADAQRIDNDQWSSLSQVDNTANGLTVTNVTVLNCHNNQGNAYWNGDGLSSEEANPGIVITNMTSKGHTDAGIDLKSSASVTGLVTGDNKRNIKLWNGEFDIVNPVLTAPNERGSGSGSPTHINLNSNNGSRPKVRITGNGTTTGDLRLFGQAGAFEFDLDTAMSTTGAIIQLINCQRDAVPVVNNNGAHIRFMIAAAAPSGSPALLASSVNFNSGSGAAIPITTNRDASYGGVIIRSIGGADAALFQVSGIGGIGQSILPVSPLTYTGTSADTKSITLTIEDIAGNQATIAFTVNVIVDTTDYRVFDVTWTGGDNSQTATDVKGHALTYGANAKVRTTLDPAGRLLIFPPASNGTTNLVRSADSADWLLDGDFTIIAEGLNFLSTTTLDGSAAPTADRIIVGQYQATSGQFGWALALDTAGRLCGLLSTGGTSGTLTRVTGTTVLSTGVDYKAKLTRSGATVKVWLDKGDGNGFVLEGTGTVSGALFDNTVNLTVGASATGTRTGYINGNVKRTVIHKGTASGT